MKVSELIEELKKMPQDSEVMKSNSEGCYDCNPGSLPSYRDIYHVQYMETGEYPNLDIEKVVVL
jgi:hypothetical protein